MILRDRPSPNHGPRPAGKPVDMLVLHYTGMKSAVEALDRLCDPAAEVSAHYLVDEDGTVWRLVPEDRRAWHAGRSFWAGETDINGVSIGIELVNPGHEFGYRAFPEAQLAALEALARGILARHAIPPKRVLGHSDVAPQRKQDPGELFPWERLARAGIGLWPRAAATRRRKAERLAAAIGYEVTEPLELVVAAFQRHWRPSRCDGVADAETLALMAAVAAA
jgi:N-acetylmuramoyl-L-alanine amidase